MDHNLKLHACKFCNKCFPCGRSLGGHMRSHVITTPTPEHLQTGYGLRENPKKTSKFVDPNDSLDRVDEDDESWVTGSFPNPSSALSEIDPEKEEVAKCLMMLSRDVWFADSSEESSHSRRDNSVQNCGSGSTELGSDFEPKLLGKKKRKFECATCSKAFHSYQALGGHRASHKKIKGCFTSKMDNKCNALNGFGPASDEKRIKRSIGHECSICFKVFSTGQALGGHKRSHLMGCSDIAKTQQASETSGIQKPAQEIRDLLDLNLPAPVEHEGNQFKTWWVGSGHHHKGKLTQQL